jgi:hypothetical protein
MSSKRRKAANGTSVAVQSSSSSSSSSSFTTRADIEREVEEFRARHNDPLLKAPSILENANWRAWVHYQALHAFVDNLNSRLVVQMDPASDSLPDERTQLKHLHDCRLSMAALLCQWQSQLALSTHKYARLFELAMCSIRLLPQQSNGTDQQLQVRFRWNAYAFFRNDKYRIPARLHIYCNATHLSWQRFLPRFVQQTREAQAELHTMTAKCRTHLEHMMHLSLIEDSLLPYLQQWASTQQSRMEEEEEETHDGDKARDAMDNALDALPDKYPFVQLAKELRVSQHALERYLCSGGRDKC